MKQEESYSYKQLDPLLHSPIRLAVISLLYSCEEAEFTYIRDKVGTTDGNLNSHLGKLEAKGWLKVRKTFIKKKPVTYQKLTESGRQAFRSYVSHLENFIDIDKGDKE